MKKLLLYWFSIAVSLALVDVLFTGVEFRSYFALGIGALVLGFVNAVVRPIITLLTLPVTIVTLGLFYLVVNGIAFGLAAYVVPGFHVSGPATAIVAALFTSVISTVLEMLVGGKD